MQHDCVIRRLRRIIVAGEIVAEFARHGKRTIEIESVIPESARFVSAHVDTQANGISVIFEDASWDEVPLGGMIPLLPPPVICETKQ